jgi:hypothetical protein
VDARRARSKTDGCRGTVTGVPLRSKRSSFVAATGTRRCAEKFGLLIDQAPFPKEETWGTKTAETKAEGTQKQAST